MSGNKSLGTGILLGLAAWTLTRLVAGVVDHATLEYEVAASPEGTGVIVNMTNLSHAAPVSGLKVELAGGSTRFVRASCHVEPPSFASYEDFECWPGPEVDVTSGADHAGFVTTRLYPGHSASQTVGCMRCGGGRCTPGCSVDGLTLRVEVASPGSIRLLPPGIQTWIARNEVRLHLSLLVVVAVLFLFSLYWGADGRNRSGGSSS